MQLAGLGGYFVAATPKDINDGVAEVLEIFFGPMEQARQVLVDALDEVEGFSATDSFSRSALGGARQAGNLAWNHEQAMEVYSETLTAMHTDLANFLEAFVSLKSALEEDDQNTAAHLKKVENALTAISHAGNVDTASAAERHAQAVRSS